MELFNLQGTINVDNDSANESIRQTNQNASGLSKIFGNLGGIAMTAGAAVATVGVAAAAAAGAIGYKAVTAATDFNKSLNTLQTQTGSTKEEINGLGEGMKEIYKMNLGESFDDIGQAMALVKQQSLALGAQSEKDITSITKNALLLRDTFELDVNMSVNTVSTMVKNFGITADEAFNIIAQGAQQGANKQGDLLEILNEYSPHFKALGMDAETFMNTLISGAESGAWSIDKMGDAVKEFNIRSKDGSKASAEAYQALGFNADKMFNTFANGGKDAEDSFVKVNEKLLGMKDKVKQNEIGVALWGTMWEDLEKEGIEALIHINDSTDKTIDTMGEISKIKYKDFGSALEGIGRQIEVDLLIPLGDAVLPLLNKFANWFGANIPTVVTFISNMTNKFGTFFNLLQGGQFDTIKEKLKAMFPPEFHAAIESVVNYWEKFKTVMDETINFIMEMAEPTIQIFKDTFAELDIDTIVESFTQFYNTLQNDVLPAVKPLVELLAMGLIVQIGIAVGAINGIIKALDNVAAMFFDTYTIIANILGFIVALITRDTDKMKSTFFNIFNGIRSLLNNFGQAGLDIISGFVEGVIKFFRNLYNKLVGKSIVPDLVKGITKGFKKIVDKGQIVVDIFNKIKDGIVKVIGKVGQLKFPKLPSFKGLLKGYAKGGVMSGDWSVVGEEGPEIVKFPAGTRVYSNDDSKSMLSGKMSKDKESIVVNINKPQVFKTADIEKYIATPFVNALQRKGILSY